MKQSAQPRTPPPSPIVPLPAPSPKDRAAVAAHIRRALDGIQRDLAQAQRALGRQDLAGAAAIMAGVRDRLKELAAYPDADRTLRGGLTQSRSHLEFAARRAAARDVEGAVRGITLATGALQKALDAALAQRQQAGGPEP